MANIDLGVTSATPKPKPEPIKDQRGSRWVTIPERDLFDFTHPPVAINHAVYGPGKHFVAADTADWIEDRLRRKFESDIRVMRPNQDFTSQNAMNRFGAGSRQGSFVANPETEMP